jgi:hypothetical protein
MLNKKWRLLGMGGIVIGKSEVEIENATLNVGCGPWLTPIGSISTRRKNFKREPRREPAVFAEPPSQQIHFFPSQLCLIRRDSPTNDRTLFLNESEPPK